MTATALTVEFFKTMAVIAKDENLLAKLLAYAKQLIKEKQDDPTLMTKEEFLAKLEQGEEEYRQGKTVRLREGETLSEMLRRTGL